MISPHANGESGNAGMVSTADRCQDEWNGEGLEIILLQDDACLGFGLNRCALTDDSCCDIGRSITSEGGGAPWAQEEFGKR